MYNKYRCIVIAMAASSLPMTLTNTVTMHAGGDDETRPETYLI